MPLVGGKNVIYFLSNLSVSAFQKVWWVVWIGSFRPKLLQTKTGQKLGPHENEFWLFFKFRNECYKQLEQKK